MCQNVGAKHARYNVLFFLHADTILEHGFDTKVIKSAQDPKTIVGAFTFGVDRSIMVRPLVGMYMLFLYLFFCVFFFVFFLCVFFLVCRLCLLKQINK